MPAYNSNFLAPIQASVNVNTITGAVVTSNIPNIEEKEILIVGGEIILAGPDLDIVSQVVSTTPIIISVDLTTTTPAGEVVPFVPSAVVDSVTGTTTQNPVVAVVTEDTTVSIPGVKMVETYLDAAFGPYIVAHKRSRAWSVLQDPAATFIAYESTDSGISLVKRPYEAAPISQYPKMTAGRESDKTYLSIYIEKASLAEFPTIYVTKGIIGVSVAGTTYGWERPYLPVCIACDGTRFVVLTEGNRIYSTLDGVSWSYDGLLSPIFPFILSTQLESNYTTKQLYSNTQGVFLQWLPAVSRWILRWPGNTDLYVTAAANAVSGWVKATPPAVTVSGGIVTSYSMHSGHLAAAIAGAIYIVGIKKVDSLGSITTASAIYKSSDNGLTWAVKKAMLPSSLYGSNGDDAVLDRMDIIDGAPVAYTRGFSPVRWKSTDAGTTWVKQATNLPEAAAEKLLVLSSSAVAIVNLGSGSDIYRYAPDGLIFDDLGVATVDTSTGAIIPAPAGPTDPYWANVTAMGWCKYPLGLLAQASASNQNPTPSDEGKGAYVGWHTGAHSVVELPYLGNPVVKTNTLAYAGGWVEPGQQFLHTPGTTSGAGPGGSLGLAINQYVGELVGDFTYEQVYANDESFAALYMFLGSQITIRLGVNLGSTYGAPIAREIKIRTGGSFPEAPVYSNIPVFDLPPARTYYHFAIERYGNVISVYINGELKGSVTQTLPYALLSSLRIWSIYYGQFRLTDGIARYKGPFTPPTALFPAQ